MFADIVNYTAIMQDSETTARSILEVFQTALQESVAENNGQIVNSYGDGCLVKFNSAESALVAATDIQKTFQRAETKVPVRIGIHLGDVFYKEGNIYGNNVNIASRIESFSSPGSILFSEEVEAQISNKEIFRYRVVGQAQFKNDKKIRKLFALQADGLVVPKWKDLKGKGRLHISGTKLWTSLITLVLITFLGMWFLKDPIQQDGREVSIAVLPLQNLTKKSEDLGYLGDGLTVELIDELSKIESIQVTSFTQSVFYKESKMSPKEIADELEVDYIVSGSIRLKNLKDLALSLEMFSPYSNERIWNKQIHHALNSAHEIQIELASDVAKRLGVQLTSRENASIGEPKTNNGESFRLFLKAKSEMDNLNPEALLRANDYLARAISLDSTYAQAYTLKAWNIILRADPLINPSAQKENIELLEGKKLIESSLRLAPNFSDTYIVRSGFYLYVENNVKAAIEDIEKAIELKSWPKVPTNYCTCAMVAAMIAGERITRAEEILEIAKKVDPENILAIWDHGNIEMSKENFEKAEELFEQAYVEEPNEYFRGSWAQSLFHNGQYEKIISVYETENKDLTKVSLLGLSYLASAYHKVGRRGSYKRIWKELKARDRLGNNNIYKSMMHLNIGNLEKGLELFEKAYQMKEIGVAMNSSIDPAFELLESEERYNYLRNEMIRG